MNWELVEAARDLGAGAWQTFRHGIFPQIRPGMLAGAALVFLPATGQFVIPDLLGGAKTVLLGNLLQQQFGASRDWPFGAAIATVTIAIVLLGLWFQARLMRRPA
jgi:spermidine/putrescine transport system permease protein